MKRRKPLINYGEDEHNQKVVEAYNLRRISMLLSP